ncbi:MAG: CPBP family intramembrane metalloprotease [Acidobacteriia bacterium]|nr:CPBP family intramembrane metalloprotease [Terriglobia bacterium]
MAGRKDPLRIAVSIGVYAVVSWGGQIVFFLMLSMAGTLAGFTLATLSAAIFANWLALRVYEDRSLLALGLYAHRASAENLALGILGGAGAACLVLTPPLLIGAAHWVRLPEAPGVGTLPFLIVLLAAGSAGEEILIHGYGFQALIRMLGRWPAVLLVGVIFGAMHSANPHESPFGLANTAGFGVLFGYAFLRSRDLWLPIGLHFGWNFTLPLFGVNLSGLKMIVTSHEIVWAVGPLWSGGEYGPEASLLTSAVLVVLLVFLWRAPLRRQTAPLIDSNAEPTLCAPASSPPSP